MWTDADTRPFAEKPKAYFSPWAWDAADQTVFRPISRVFAIDPVHEAINVNALDEVPSSSWFQNRLGRFPMTPAEIARGSCRTPPLDPAGPWKVTDAKPDGANPGFLIVGPDARRYLIKFDGSQAPRATAAGVVGARLYSAAGYFAPCNRIVYFDPSILEIAEDAAVEGEKGKDSGLEPRHIARVLSKGQQLRDGRYRAMSSLMLEGKPLGPFGYQGTRKDDPNDIIAHEDRRELRGMRVLASWINHFDSREKNTLSMWIGTGKGRGYVRHHLIDFGDSLGSYWKPPALGRRLGHSHYLDLGHVFGDWLTLGLIERPWERSEFGKSGFVFAYFDAESFTPEKWRPGYPNPAFGRMQEGDAAWMARIIARFSDAHVDAVVAAADLRDPLLIRELTRILRVRRDKILDRYLRRLSPLTAPQLDGRRLCLTDLLVTSGLDEPSERKDSVRAWASRKLRRRELRPRRVPHSGERPKAPAREAGPSRQGGARICVLLPAVRGASRSAPKYLIVDFLSQTQGRRLQPPARVHLYHRGSEDYRVVGLERPARLGTPDG